MCLGLNGKLKKVETILTSAMAVNLAFLEKKKGTLWTCVLGTQVMDYKTHLHQK